MLEFAELLTVSPATVSREDVDNLRAAGWRDEDVVDIVHIVGLFNYLVRMADGLGIAIEPEEAPYLEQLPFHGHVTSKSVGNAVAAPKTKSPTL